MTKELKAPERIWLNQATDDGYIQSVWLCQPVVIPNQQRAVEYVRADLTDYNAAILSQALAGEPELNSTPTIWQAAAECIERLKRKCADLDEDNELLRDESQHRLDELHGIYATALRSTEQPRDYNAAFSAGLEAGAKVADERERELDAEWPNATSPSQRRVLLAKSNTATGIGLAIRALTPSTEDDGWVTFGRIKVDVENETETFTRIPLTPSGEAHAATETPQENNNGVGK